jgi:5'-3' exonuclease
MRVHLVDGTFELFRAHFSPRPDRPNKATVGLVGSMLALLSDPDELVTHVAIAFDNPIVSFRNELFDGYKSDEGVPPVLRAQFDLAEEAVRALGIVVWSMSEFEADDALATAATRFAAAPGVGQVRIMTPDKDLGQCVVGSHVVQVDRMRRRIFDEEAVRTARGVGPASVPDLLALVGDTSDGIPGITGFGAKSAAAVLRRWSTVEAIPDDAARWDVKVTGAPRLAATLAAHRQDALLYKKLATLVRDVPLGESIGDLAHRGVPRAPFENMLEALDARDLARLVRPVRPVRD